MKIEANLQKALACLRDNDYSGAYRSVSAFTETYPKLNLIDKRDNLARRYSRVVDYWLDGYVDPDFDGQYGSCIKELYGFVSDAILLYDVTHGGYLAAAYNRMHKSWKEYSIETFRSALEKFVGDVAMLELEQPHKLQDKKLNIYSLHAAVANDLFDYIISSPQWTAGQAQGFLDMLLSPTIADTDRQLVVSAVMIACLEIFDFRKFKLLADVCLLSDCEAVRQRALVGWAFVLTDKNTVIYPEVRQVVLSVVGNERLCSELLELQMQLYYCLNESRDTKKLHDEIMPNLIKNNNLRITPNGIEEKDDDPMDDILHPEAAERNMEQLENSFNKMKEMQQGGADIYFAGFSQMKRFPFFDRMSNWFLPYYAEHPSFLQIADDGGSVGLATRMALKAPFCDSDKYSFVFAMKDTLKRVPASMREMLSSSANLNFGELMGVDAGSPAILRRQYLQGLYRFYKVFPARTNFCNPFGPQADGDATPRYLFFANKLFSSTPLTAESLRLAAFLYKMGHYVDMRMVLSVVDGNAGGSRYYMLRGNMLLRLAEQNVADYGDLSAAECFGKVLQTEPDNAKALAGYARALFSAQRYDEAATAYSRLVDMKPDSFAYKLYYSTSLTNAGHYSEAVMVLYELYYVQPDNIGVKRVLARALMGEGKYAKALEFYKELDKLEGKDTSDILNYALCLWLVRDMRHCKDKIQKYINACRGKGDIAGAHGFIKHVVEPEGQFLLSHGVSEAELLIMGSQVD